MAREYSTEELSGSDDPFLMGMLAERQRILALHAAHRELLEKAGLWPRLPNMVEGGADLRDPPETPDDWRPFVEH